MVFGERLPTIYVVQLLRLQQPLPPKRNYRGVNSPLFIFMEVLRRNFPSILPDNEEQYFKFLEAVISSVDELSAVQITRKMKGYMFRISPSAPHYSQALLKEILQYHTLLGIRVEMSKSIRNTSTIGFEITIN